MHRFMLIACLTMAACSDNRGDSTATQRTEVGDTTIVQVGLPVWGEGVGLVEEATIGQLDGPEEYQFGDFIEIAVDRDLGVYVFDGQDPTLRYYDRDGLYVRTLGTEGEGPGEYKDVALGLAVRRTDGRLVMRDPRNGRINVYDPDGTPSQSWPVASGLFTSDAFAVDSADHMYSKILTSAPEPEKAWPIAFLQMDEQGQIVDTVIPPRLPGEPEEYAGAFGVAKVWTLHTHGGLVVGLNRQYVFEHRRLDGTVLRVIRDVPNAQLTSGERQEHEDRNAWRRRALQDDPPPVPSSKPAYRSIRVDEDGRIFVRRFVAAEQGEPVVRAGLAGGEAPPPMSWREPNIYDVFDPQGDLLGTLRLPANTEIRASWGDHVWGVRRGTFGEPIVVRFRVAQLQ